MAQKKIQPEQIDFTGDLTIGGSLELPFGSIESDASGLTIVPNGTRIDLNSSSGQTYINGAVVPTVSSTSTLTNKRMTPREFGYISGSTSSTFAVDADLYDMAYLGGHAANFTVSTPTGTPTQGQKLLLRIKDNGTARTITWNAIFRAIGVTLPTTTVANKTVYIGMVYNLTDTKWDVVGVQQEV